MSKTSYEVKAQWNKAHYDRIGVLVPKDKINVIKQYCTEHNLSLNGLINELLMAEMGYSDSNWNKEGKLLTNET